MDPRTVTGRVVHGGYPFFKEAAPRIEAVVPDGDLPILTRGALHLEPPAHYWFYNTEPLHVRGKMNAAYIALLEGAERVFDYSQANRRHYPRGEFCPIQLGSIAFSATLATCDLADVLFYGYPTPRRADILDALPTTTITAFGDTRTHWIRRAKIVLCLNAYDDANGNPFRVFPVLEAGGRVVAERSQETWFNEAVEPHAYAVVPYANLVSTCQRILKDADANGA